MKVNNQSPKLHWDIKSTASNLFFNLIILFLGTIVIFLAYSLFTKFKAKNEADYESANKKKASVIVQVEVLNGCGISGSAEKITDYLRKNNFDVVQLGNFRSFDVDKSIVVDRTGNKANAVKVADALGIDHTNIVEQINNDYILDVSLIIGKDFSKLKTKL